MSKLTTQESDYLCSAGFVALAAAQLYFKAVYDSLEAVFDEEASKRADYKALKAKDPVQAKLLRKEMQKQYFNDDERMRYKIMMKHIHDLMGDFEWTESFAMMQHLTAKLKPCEFMDIFDSYHGCANDLARLILLWSDFVDQQENGIIKAESFLKQYTPKQVCGGLAARFVMQ